MRVISLGWGVQSFALAAMSALGELPSVDAAIHADTTHERADTYAFIVKWTPWLESRDVRVVTVSDPDDAAKVWKGEMIPAYTGDGGKAFRTCTHRWKIQPMRQWIQANRNSEQVEQWLGISWDEVQRARHSDVGYITNKWPLLDKRMTRKDCASWLTAHGLEIPPKSACVFCPMHSNAAWRSLLPGDMARAVDVDEAIRHSRHGVTLYLHPKRIPLTDVDMRTQQARGQLDMFDDECEGVCFI